MFIILRERQSTSVGGTQREGDTETEAHSRLWSVTTEPDVGLKATNCEIMTWTEVRRLTDWATQVRPKSTLFDSNVADSSQIKKKKVTFVDFPTYLV